VKLSKLSKKNEICIGLALVAFFIVLVWPRGTEISNDSAANYGCLECSIVNTSVREYGLPYKWLTRYNVVEHGMAGVHTTKNTVVDTSKLGFNVFSWGIVVAISTLFFGLRSVKRNAHNRN
jgi:hypothetical protein